MSGGAITFTGCAEQAESEAHSHAEGDEHNEHGEHDEAGHGDHEARTFEESVAELASMKDSICKAFADGTPEEAHDALHEVGHMLETLPSLASKELKLDDESMKSLDAAVEALFDGFGQLDETFHGGEEVDAEQIDKGLTQALDQRKAAVL